MGALSIHEHARGDRAAGEHGTGLLQEARSVYLWFFSSRWVRVWTNLRVEKPHYSDQEEEGGKCELTGSRGGWGGGKEGAQGWGLPYLDLFGVKCHNKTKEQEGGNADGAFNQEQVERPLLEGTEKGVRS